MDSHGNARRDDTLKYAADSREESPSKKSLRIAPPLLPIAIQTVYSLQITVPVVQRIERRFPNPAGFPSHEGSKTRRNRQIAPIPVLKRHLSGNKWRRIKATTLAAGINHAGGVATGALPTR
jgi:hypothetical protein